MLTYLILTTRALMMVTIVLGAIIGYTKLKGEKYQRNIVYVETIIGFVISFVIAYFRNATSLIDSAILNGWIYAISLISFVLFLILSIKPLAERNRVMGTLQWLFLGAISITVIAYATPDVWGYPYHVLLNEKTIISTDFLLSMIGMVLGLVLMIVGFMATQKILISSDEKIYEVVLRLELLVNAIVRLSGFFSVLLQKKIVKSNHTMFTYTVFVKNHGDLFIYISLIIIVVVSAIMCVRSFTQKEPYRNPAEHRKILAKWLKIRRWGGASLVVAILAICTMTVFEKMNETDVTLSPIEDATAVDNENVYVSFDLVSDGHLHRFAYETENGVTIRFIVIKKPNSSSYGIGLDACDVCGETGYYEKDGQVVCNLCDVVMNISTIGFKGGCNPIVIPYQIEDGQIIVPIDGLLEYESEFK